MRKDTAKRLRNSARESQLRELTGALLEERKLLMAIVRRLDAMQSDRRQKVPDHKVNEAAALLNVGSATVYRLIASGELVAMQVGRCMRIRDEDLQDFRLRMRIIKGDGLTQEA